MNQTVFFSTGRGMYRFRHRIWEEHLAARYLARCISLRKPGELLPRAGDVSVYRSAGEMLARRGTVIGPATVDSLDAFIGRAEEQAVLGNFAAVVGNSQIAIEDAAMAPLLQQLDRYPPTARFVALNSYSRRAVFPAPNNPIDMDIGRRLRDLLVTVYDRYAADPQLHTMIRSLAWCYQMTAHRLWKTAAPKVEWPRLEADRDRGGRVRPEPHAR